MGDIDRDMRYATIVAWPYTVTPREDAMQSNHIYAHDFLPADNSYGGNRRCDINLFGEPLMVKPYQVFGSMSGNGETKKMQCTNEFEYTVDYAFTNQPKQMIGMIIMPTTHFSTGAGVIMDITIAMVNVCWSGEMAPVIDSNGVAVTVFTHGVEIVRQNDMNVHLVTVKSEFEMFATCLKVIDIICQNM